MKATKERRVNLDILRNMIYALTIALYFILLIVCEKFVEKNLLFKYIKVSSMVFLLITIYIFEKAYKEDSGKLAFHSMEFFVLSINAILLEYLSSVFKIETSNYIAGSAYTFLIYYVIKSMIIYTKFRKEQLDSLSDIAEIVKEEPTKKEPTKRVKVEENIKEDIKEETKKETTSKAKEKTVSKKEVKEKKQSRKKVTKKVVVDEEKIEEVKVEDKKEEIKTARRGRPKKQVESQKEEKGEEVKKEVTNEQIKEESKEVKKTTKRGRPKKETVAQEKEQKEEVKV